MAFQQINGKQIRSGSIDDSHIKGKLSENVLDINWESASHTQSLLKNKVILDYIQLVTPVTFADGTSSSTVNLTLDDNASGALPGVVVGETIRFRTTDGDPLIGPDKKEVVGKITAQVGPGSLTGFDYTVALFNSDGATPYKVPQTLTVEILYAVRTTLWDAAENFASNERFIDGAVDIRSKLDITQLAKDVFGDSYVFNENGDATQPVNLVDVVTSKTTGSTINTKSITATEIIDEVYTARGGKVDLATRLTEMANASSTAVTTLTKDLASVDNGKGASLIGVEDAKNNFTSANVEGVLGELASADKEIVDELSDARGNKATLAERLSVSIDDDGKLVDSRLHVHGSHAFVLSVASSTIDFDSLSTPKITSSMLVDGVDTIEVYVNGSLQAETFHYVTKVLDGKITGVDFTPEVIQATTDVVILKWAKYSV